jgi:hypothetical protein
MAMKACLGYVGWPRIAELVKTLKAQVGMTGKW